jgi:hypothetical protein
VVEAYLLLVLASDPEDLFVRQEDGCNLEAGLLEDFSLPCSGEVHTVAVSVEIVVGDVVGLELAIHFLVVLERLDVT